MIKLITISLHFHLAAMLYSPSPILKTFFRFRRDSYFLTKGA